MVLSFDHVWFFKKRVIIGTCREVFIVSIYEKRLLLCRVSSAFDQTAYQREKTKLVAHAKLITFLTNQLHGTQFKSWLSTSKDVTKVFTASCALTITKRRNTEIHS